MTSPASAHTAGRMLAMDPEAVIRRLTTVAVGVTQEASDPRLKTDARIVALVGNSTAWPWASNCLGYDRAHTIIEETILAARAALAAAEGVK